MRKTIVAFLAVLCCSWSALAGSIVYDPILSQIRARDITDTDRALLDSIPSTFAAVNSAIATKAAADSLNHLDASKIVAGTVDSARLPDSGASAGSYTNANITVDAKGMVTGVSSGPAPGETNTASNAVAAGSGLFKEKSGVDLVFKRLVAGSNISLSEGADTLTITATSGGLGVITTATTIYVATTGDDTSGTGAVDAPFLTVAKAFSHLDNYMLMAAVTIQVADGTYNMAGIVVAHQNSSRISLVGNTTTPANCVLNFSTDGTVGFSVGSAKTLNIRGFRLVGPNTSNSTGIYGCDGGVVTDGTKMELHNWQYAVYAERGANISMPAVKITTAQYGIHAYLRGAIFAAAANVSNCSSIGVLVQYGSFGNVTGATVTGCGTGLVVYADGYIVVSTGTLTGNTAVSSPELNTVGSGNSYIFN